MVLFFLPLVGFIIVFPWLAFVRALAFGAVCVRPPGGTDKRLVDYGVWLLAAITWGAYGLWESWVHTQDPAPDIRVDLLLAAPLLYFVTISACARWLRIRRAPSAESGSSRER